MIFDFEPGDTHSMWQRSSDAFGGAFKSDALGPVNLGAERVKHRTVVPPKEVGDTLRWTQPNDEKSAALARFYAHAEASKSEAKDTLRWRPDGTRGDQVSRTQAPDKRRIVGLLARDDDYHHEGIALPPGRARAQVSSKIGQAQGGEQHRSEKGAKMEQVR